MLCTDRIVYNPQGAATIYNTTLDTRIAMLMRFLSQSLRCRAGSWEGKGGGGHIGIKHGLRQDRGRRTGDWIPG